MKQKSEFSDIISYYSFLNKRELEIKKRTKLMDQKVRIHKALIFIFLYVIFFISVRVFYISSLDFESTFNNYDTFVLLFTLFVNFFVVLGMLMSLVNQEPYKIVIPFFTNLYNKVTKKGIILKYNMEKELSYKEAINKIKISEKNKDEYYKALNLHYLNGTINDLDEKIIKEIIGYSKNSKGSQYYINRTRNELENEESKYLENY